MLGRVKSRLAAEVGALEAYRVALRMLECTLALASTHWPGPVYCAAWPTTQHRAVRQLCQRYHVELIAQSAGNLGAKMSDIFFRLSPCAILGTDVPHCPPSTLQTAAHWLNTGKNLIGPAEDGGYFLIGLQRPWPALFQNIGWGTDQVYRQTRTTADRLNLRIEALATLYDLDHMADLTRLINEHPDWKARLKPGLWRV